MATAATSNESGSPDDKKADKGADNKFDLNSVKIDELPEEVQNIVKGFQADYTKKTQAVSEKEKLIGEQEDDIKRGKEWGEWYKRNENTLAQYNEYAKNLSKDGAIHPDNKPKDDGDDDGDAGSENDMFSDDSKKVKKELKGDIGQIRGELKQQKEDTNNTFQTGMNMMVSLMEEIQTSEYEFKINPKKVIDYAQTEGITDMKKAVQGAYGKEIIDAAIASGIKDGIEKEKEKLNLQVVNETMPQGRKTLKVLKRGDKK